MASKLTIEEISERLLAHLRQELGASGLAYAKPPEILKYVQSAICAFELEAPPPELSGPLILRLRRRARLARFALRERAVHAALIEAGAPVPRALMASMGEGPLGLPFTITERVEGHPALGLWSGPFAFARMASTVAAVQLDLHALDTEAFLRTAERHGVQRDALTLDDPIDYIERRVRRNAIDWLAPGISWLHEMRRRGGGERVVCHGDLHGSNILLRGGAVEGVIDWEAAMVADPAYDVAATLSAIETRNDFSHVLRPLIRPAVARVRERYLRAYRSTRPLDMEAVRFYQARRLAFWMVQRPRNARRYAAGFRAVTSVSLQPPP